MSMCCFPGGTDTATYGVEAGRKMDANDHIYRGIIGRKLVDENGFGMKDVMQEFSVTRMFVCVLWVVLLPPLHSPMMVYNHIYPRGFRPTRPCYSVLHP
jgi:hypothetical protein